MRGHSMRRRHSSFYIAPRPAGNSVESLETRVLFSTYTVTTLGDDAGIVAPAGPDEFTATTLRAALTAANTRGGPDTIGFAPAVYGSIDLATALPAVGDDLTLVGPGSSALTVRRSAAAATDFSVLTINAGKSATLFGLTLSGGTGTLQNPGPFAKHLGGGILNAGYLNATGCNVTGNSVGIGDGGGIYNAVGGTLILSFCSLTDNAAMGGGGGVENAQNGKLTLDHCTLSGNTGNEGGAVRNSSGTLTLSFCNLFNNRGRGNGGGINSAGLSTVSDCSFTDNSAFIVGGGATFLNGNGVLTRCTFSGNSAFAGGGLSKSAAAVTLINCTFSGNTATGPVSGGGGGGIRSSGGSAAFVITNCTLTGNTASTGGGIFNASPLSLSNSIVAGNFATDSTSPGDIFSRVAASGSFNFIGVSSGDGLADGVNGNRVGVAAADLLLDTLADNGGPTQTIALLPGSPAIDAGGNAPAVGPDGAPLATDGRGTGFPRVVNGRVDVGAFEVQPPPPTVSVHFAEAAEGNSGTKNLTFTVTLSAASTKVVTVAYTTADWTATAGSDYVAKAGTLTFAPGQTTKAIAVGVKGDVTFEGDETFVLELDAPTNATLGDGYAYGTIINDDPPPPPKVRISDATGYEGDAGLSPVTFKVSLDSAATKTVKVFYATSNGTAKAGSDYNAAGGTVTFAPGERQKQITVFVKGDKAKEPNETFFVALSKPVNAVIADGQGRGLIRDDDTILYRAIPLTAPGVVNTTGAEIGGGQEVGGGDGHAYLWAGPALTPTDLHPSGFTRSFASGVFAGQQVGYGANADGPNHALLWSGTAASAIDLHPAGYVRSEASATTGSRQGGSGGVETTPGAIYNHALLWSGSADSVVDLHPQGFYSSGVSAMAGDVQYGWGTLPVRPYLPEQHALMWHGTADSVVDLHPRHLSFTATGIAGVGGGQQVGYGYGYNVPETIAHALLWKGTAESAVDLTPPEFPGATAYATNGHQQVGASQPNPFNSNSPVHALAWSGTAESFVDLHRFLPAEYTRSIALGIDAAGNVIGYAEKHDSSGTLRTQAFVWKPV